MIATNALVFSMLTSLQQLVAVYYPFKLKIWVTKQRTRIAVALAYGSSMVYHAFLYLAVLYITNQKSLGFFVKLIVSVIAVNIVIMQVAVFSKLAMKTACCCAGNSLTTSENSQKHGDLRNKKTAVISLTMTGGALAVTISAFLRNTPRYHEIMLTLMYVLWIVTPLVYITLNWQVVLKAKRCPKSKTFCCCGKNLSQNMSTKELTFTITK